LKQSLPNILSVLRMILIIPIAWGLWHHGATLTLPPLWLTLIIGIAFGTDALDGWIARKKGYTTELGKLLDPVADKLLLLTLFAMALLSGRISWFLLALILLRDVIIVWIGLRIRHKTGATPGARSLGKVTALMLILTWVLVYYAPSFEELHLLSMVITILFLVLSSIDYGRYAYKTLSNNT